MDYNIIDGNNSKVRSVCFEEIEKIVEIDYQKLLNEPDEENNEYEEMYDNDLLCLKMDYEINYLKKDLLHIMKYYGLPTRKKNKENCIDDILEFELQSKNASVVDHRKTLWLYLEELENDEYLSQFIHMN